MNRIEFLPVLQKRTQLISRKTVSIAPLKSPRLIYRRLHDSDVDAFHSLVADEHIRRYLLDGKTVDRDWCKEQIQSSDIGFASFKMGLWLVYVRDLDSEFPIGFCGFMTFEEMGPEPQLIYGLLAAYAGKGYATEMARALVVYAKQNTSLSILFAAVDEPNVASSRVLEKAGFRFCGDHPGALGLLKRYCCSI